MQLITMLPHGVVPSFSSFPEDTPTLFYQLISNCWSRKAKERPTFDHIVAKLCQLYCKNRIEPVVLDNKINKLNKNVGAVSLFSNKNSNVEYIFTTIPQSASSALTELIIATFSKKVNPIVYFF
eukprot:TRINITY_DN8711_c0_g1_i1.p1 TRINITY_DN8711_c0_g1~~TRINITY_DN8711_c0_g1_i1.p1  ORF type:complete len:124 (-),score=20.39 TRINITY_DN8711_c0_g1_i1:358-729(-)